MESLDSLHLLLRFGNLCEKITVTFYHKIYGLFSFYVPFSPFLLLADEELHHSAALVLHAISRHSPDVLQRHSSAALPLVFLAMHAKPKPSTQSKRLVSFLVSWSVYLSVALFCLSYILAFFKCLVSNSSTRCPVVLCSYLCCSSISPL